MLRLNASVHSWLTRQEMKMAKAQKAAADELDLSNKSDATITSSITVVGAATTTTAVETAVQFDGNFVDHELHKQLKNEVGDMYCAWDEADQR